MTLSAPTTKIAVLGSGGVGKSAITAQFVLSVFPEIYDPTIEDSYRKLVDIDGEAVVLEILDTAGTEQFSAMRDLYMKNGEGFVLVYSITALGTFHEIPEMFEQICRVKDTNRVPVVLVGNKCDLVDNRVVTKEEGQALATKCGPTCLFMEASAKQMYNVQKIFTDLVRHIHQINPPKKVKQGHKHQCQIL